MLAVEVVKPNPLCPVDEEVPIVRALGTGKKPAPVPVKGERERDSHIHLINIRTLQCTRT